MSVGSLTALEGVAQPGRGLAPFHRDDSDPEGRPGDGARSTPAALPAKRVLVVQSDAALADTIRRRLLAEGYRVELQADLAGAMLAVFEHAFDAVLLDRGLPDGDGRVLLGAIRRRAPRTPVLMLTQIVDTPDWLQGLEAGVSDYLVKPFSDDELAARLRAGLLRVAEPLVPAEVTVGRLRYDLLARRARVGGASLTLSRGEIELLDVLVRRAGAVASRELLAARLYGPEGAPASNALDVQVSRLRRRLEAAGAGVRLVTVRGEGYQLL